MRTTRGPRRRRVGHQRHEELDHEPRRSPTSTSCSPSPTARRGGITRLRRRGRPARLLVGKLEHKLGIKGSPTGSAGLRRRPRARRPTSSARWARACPSRWRRSSARASAPPRRRSASPRARPTTPTPTRRSASPFGKPINELQGIQFKLADMETRTAAARELLYKACAMADRGEPGLGKYSLDGQAVRLRHRDGRDRRGRAGPRRLRLRHRVPGRAHDARREDHPDLRGHQRDPAPRDRPRDEGPG